MNDYINTLLVTQHKENKFIVGLDEYDRALEFHALNNEVSLVGKIYTGIVINKIKGIGGYFIDFGEEKNGFLRTTENNELSIGETILVQVEKDAYLTKGARLTTKISLSGEYVVLVTDSNKIHISAKIKDDVRISEIKEVCQKYVNDSLGFIVRTNAYASDNIVIENEIKTLVLKYNEIIRLAKYRTEKAVIYSDDEVIYYLNNINKSNLSKIIVEDQEMFEKVNTYLTKNNITLELTIKESLYRIYDVHKFLKRALSRKVRLNSGASIVIDRTEAMYVIDVNSDKNNSKIKKNKNVLKINKEAAREIFRQLRLRNMSGIILVDFIDMDEENSIELFGYLRRNTIFDSIKTTVVDMTKLGLVEITRKRTQKALEDILENIDY